MPAAPLPPLLDPGLLRAVRAGDPSIRLLDVRTPAEFESAHIAGAWNVPLDTLAEHVAELQAAVRDPIVLVCQSGGRAAQAEAALRASGMAQLHVLAGGMNAWLREGAPVTRGRHRMSLERQVRIAAGGLVALGSLAALLLHPLAVLLPLAIGSGLVVSGVTDTCMMGLLLARLPWNRGPGCDVPAAIRALAAPPA